jgi:dihydroorotate dehydrogenase
MGLTFKNPIGLAAGFDKNGQYIEAMAQLGFGFIEVGTVTPVAQEGNPRPRLFRLAEDKALINRMGFNNGGVDAMVRTLEKTKKQGIVVGGNIGKNKNTPNEVAVDDYVKCLQKLHPHVDYFVVNVSSPNTPGLRDLQEKEPLLKLLHTLQTKNQALGEAKPMLLKISPDLSLGQIDDVVEVVKQSGLSGIIGTNTTLDRSGLFSPHQKEIGGLSGKPLTSLSTNVIRHLRQKLGPTFTIIGVGGIDSPSSALEKIEAGADLIQIYTGLIYRGPGLVSEVARSFTGN